MSATVDCHLLWQQAADAESALEKAVSVGDSRARNEAMLAFQISAFFPTTAVPLNLESQQVKLLAHL
jgi:hypothetical protein